MNFLKYCLGWLVWHLRAGFWYLTLAFRLYFAVGLDSDFDPADKAKLSDYFHYRKPRDYQKYL